MLNNEYIKAYGISYVGTLPKIKKSKDQLQPIYEAFTNSLEAIRLKDGLSEGNSICINLNFKQNLFSSQTRDLDFDSIVIEDSGIGFNDNEFDRIINLNDTGKGFSNKGSGRVQFLHFFDRSEYESIYENQVSKTKFSKRKFILSKSQAFLKNNAVIKNEGIQDIVAEKPFTKLVLKRPLNNNDLDFYKNLTIPALKENIINRYLAFFCENKNSLPEIILNKTINDSIRETDYIVSDDIPEIDKQKDIIVNYSKLLPDGRTIEKSTKSEILNLKGFKISSDKLKKNGLKMTSKGEIAKELKLENLLVDDEIDNNRYLFLLSGDFINNRDSDTRGILNIPTIEEFKKSVNNDGLFEEEEILLDDITEKANETILKMYKEIEENFREKETEILDLQAMFLLNPDSIKEAKIKLNDTTEEILEKIYKVDAKLTAKVDAEIKQRVDELNNLNPSSIDFQETFTKEVEDLTRVIPLQNRTALTQYVARRKLVLELFGKILDRKLTVQEGNKRNEDEKLLHNLIFKQKTTSSETSDLWIVNEDFVFFDGTSEGKLGEIQYRGIKIMKEELTMDEEKYRDSLEEKRYQKRPDVLLFPDEGKCIIIEFKNPDKNVSDHISQINNYASLINNLSKDEFKFNTFYGYLVGQKLDADDIQNKDSAFVNAYNFDYVFKPYYRILGKFGRMDGSLYTEAVTYRTLLDRASRRNQIFIDKLIPPMDTEMY